MNRPRGEQATAHGLSRLVFGVLLAAVFVAAPGGVRAQIVDDLFAAVVRVEAAVPANARTAEFLGTERSGSGVVIDSDGLILTIGYLILEAESAEIVAGGRRLPAKIVAYDYDSGFGLLRAIAPLDVTPIALGDSAALDEQTVVLVAGHAGAERSQRAMIVSRREFAGYWEYLLDNAIFTAPPYPDFGGAALIGADGKLVGIGSLVVGDAVPGSEPLPGNMFVPIEILKPILADMLVHGRASGPARPWLGMFTEELHGHVFVTRVAPGSPAEKARISAGDVVLAVGGKGVTTLAELFRAVWAQGDAGVDVPLTLVHGAELREIAVRSADRYDYLRLAPTH